MLISRLDLRMAQCGVELRDPLGLSMTRLIMEIVPKTQESFGLVDFYYDFLRPGEVIEPRQGYIFLDLGNRKEPGVIDHHFAEYQDESFECTTSLIYSEPELVTGWIRESELVQTIHVCVHESPDFDCIAATYLTKRLLLAKADGDVLPDGWSEWAPLLARAARQIDAGRTRIVPPEKGLSPITVYPAILGLIETEAEFAGSHREKWVKRIEGGHRILRIALELAVREGAENLDRLDLRGRLPTDLKVEPRVDERMRAFRLDALRLGLIPGGTHREPLDGIVEIHLLDRKDLRRDHPAQIAFITDPKSGGGFFKSLVRGAYHDRVQATCVFFTRSEEDFSGAPAWVQPIVSVDPESPYSLRGLGRHLEYREKEKRRKQGTPRIGPARPGYDNPDPWFDGRPFDYTIVDAPRWGTVLKPDEAREAVLDWRGWHRACREDILRRAPRALRAPLLAPEERLSVLRELMNAVICLHRDLSPVTAPLGKAAWMELAEVLREKDLEALEDERDLLRFPPFLVGLLESRRPELRWWALRFVVSDAEWRAFDAFLEKIGRRDLGLAVRMSASWHLSPTEQGELASRLREIDQSETVHALLIDALAMMDHETSHELLELGLHLCRRVAEKSGFRRSLVHLRHRLSESTAPGEWVGAARQIIAEADLFSSMTLLSPEKLDESSEALRAWRLDLCSLALTGRSRKEKSGPIELDPAGDDLEKHVGFWLERSETELAARYLCALSDREGLLADAIPDDAWSALPAAERDRRRALIETVHEKTIFRLARILLRKLNEDYAFPQEFSQRLTSYLDELVSRLFELYGVEEVIDQLAEASGLELIAATPSWGELLARGVLVAEQEWLLWMAVEEALMSGRSKPGRRWARDPYEHEVAVLLVQLSRAATRMRARPEGAPAYLIPALCMRVLPILNNRSAVWCDNAGLDQAEALVLEVGLSQLGDGSHPRVGELGDLVRSELRLRLPPSRLLDDLDASLCRGEVLDLFCRLLKRYTRCKAGGKIVEADPASPWPMAVALGSAVVLFSVELVKWVLHLPTQDDRAHVDQLVAIRHRLPLENSQHRVLSETRAAVEWAACCLENLRPAFEDLSERPRDSERLRSDVLAFRACLQHRPVGGLATVLGLALADVESYVDHKLQIAERFAAAQDHRDLDVVDEIAVELLESDTRRWLNIIWRKFGAEATDDLLDLERVLDAAVEGDGAARAERAALLARGRRHLMECCGPPSSWQTAEDLGLNTTEVHNVDQAADRAYRRVENLEHLDRRFAGRLLGEAIGWLVGEYEFRRAQCILEQHRLEPLGVAIRFWLSPWVGVLPILFLTLFLTMRSAHQAMGIVLELVAAAVFLLTLGAVLKVWRTIHHSHLGSAVPSGELSVEGFLKTPDRLSPLVIQLFMPSSLIAVMIGVLGIAFTDEFDERVAIHLSEFRLVLLAIAIASVSYWALGQLARQRGRVPSSGNVGKATVRLFTYSFFLVMVSHLVVCPLLGIEIPAEKEPLLLDSRRWRLEWLDAAECAPLMTSQEEPDVREWLPLKIVTPLGAGLIAFYPRHLVLYSFLGMFAGIFVNVLFRGESSSQGPG